MILMGERRWRAAQMAGLAELSCIVHEGDIRAEERLVIQLVENAVRADLTPIEQARAYRRLIDVKGWSARQLAAELAVAPSTVTRALGLLTLPDEVQAQVDGGQLAAHLAYEVSKLDTPYEQAMVAQVTVDQKLTRGEVDDLVKAVRAKRPAPAARPEPVALDLGDGCTVMVKWRKGGGLTALQALRRATKLLQDRERSDEQAA